MLLEAEINCEAWIKKEPKKRNIKFPGDLPNFIKQ